MMHLKLAGLFLLCSSLSVHAAEIKLYEIGFLYSLPDSKKITVKAPKNFSINTTSLKQHAWENLKNDPRYKDHSWPYLELSYDNKKVDNNTSDYDLKRMLGRALFVFLPNVELIKVRPNPQFLAHNELALNTTFDLSIATIRKEYLEQNPTLKDMKLTLIACKKDGSKRINSDHDMTEILKNISSYSYLYMFCTDHILWPLKGDENNTFF